MKKVILNFAWAFAALLFGASCEDDIGVDYESCWANERDDRLYFTEELGEGLCIYREKSSSNQVIYDYWLGADSIYLFPMHSSVLDALEGYPFKLEGNRFTIYGFEGIAENSFKRK